MKKLIFIILLFTVFLSNAQIVMKALEGVFVSTKTSTYSKEFSRNNCADNGSGRPILFSKTVTASAESVLNQQDADAKAEQKAYNLAVQLVNNEGQNYANSNGKCIWTFTATQSINKYITKNEYGITCGGVSANITATYTAYSNTAFQDASSRAITNALSMINSYPISSLANKDKCVPNYTCYNETRSEYITGQSSNEFSSCPTSFNYSTGASYSSASQIGSGIWGYGGSSGGQCTKRYYDFFLKKDVTKTEYQQLKIEKRTVCSANFAPSTTYINVSAGNKSDNIAPYL